MDKHKDNGILLATDNLLKFVAGVMDLSKPDNELLNNVYREISEATGIDTALELYRLFKGQQVTFPVRFLNPACKYYYLHQKVCFSETIRARKRRIKHDARKRSYKTEKTERWAECVSVDC